MNKARNYGYWSTLDSNSIIDISIEVGFEFVILDMEHGLHTIDSIARSKNLLKKANRKVFARIPRNGFSLIQRLHDIGIDGILFPMLHERDDIVRAIKETSLQPKGELGYNPFVSRYEYGNNNDIFSKDLKCIGMIEDLDLFENTLKDYISLGIDGCYLGAYDMNIKAGYKGDMGKKSYLNKLFECCELLNENSNKIESFGMDLTNAIKDQPYYINKYKFHNTCLFVDSGFIFKTWKQELQEKHKD